MKTRITALCLLMVILSCVLSGCACEHEWKEATCLAPRTCTLCQETEGEPLGHTWMDATCAAAKTCMVCGETEGEPLVNHTWKEANYQEPKTCTECGVTEGEPIPADFETHGLITLKPELGKEYDYVTNCYDNAKKKTVGKLVIQKYETVQELADADCTRVFPNKEGYVWKIIAVDITFGDKNANKYGMSVLSPVADYYQIRPWEPGGASEYMMNYHGHSELVPTWILADYWSGWKKNENHYGIELAFQVPQNYDGVVFGFCNAALRQEGEVYIYEMADEDSLLFRLD